MDKLFTVSVYKVLTITVRIFFSGFGQFAVDFFDRFCFVIGSGVGGKSSEFFHNIFAVNIFPRFAGKVCYLFRRGIIFYKVII
jgi:hypothetical protein